MKSSRNYVRGAIVVAVATSFFLISPDRLRSWFEPTAQAASMVFVVNTTNDADDGVCNAAHCSLREAIKAANANPGSDSIHFNIPGPGVHTIAPATALPSLTGIVTIDGYSQPGASVNTLANGDNAVLLIELSGPGLSGCCFTGLELAPGSGGSFVKGVVVNGFGDGIFVRSSHTVIQGNFIGTDPTGTIAVGNILSGIRINGEANMIGLDINSARNVISGNGNGVDIASSGADENTVMGNFIGTAANGASPLGNRNAGVFIDNAAFDNLIGGPTPGTGKANIIAFNGTQGVLLNTSATGNAVRFNSIHSNGNLGIDLASGGDSAVTPNDTGDGDAGPNNLQNFPVISSASGAGTLTTVAGFLNSQPSSTFQIEIYSNPSCDPLGHGEGEKFNATVNVTTSASGSGTWSVQIPTSEFIGPYLTATATDLSGNTSEFSQCVPAIASSFTVNSTADTDDGFCAATPNGCTLREAVTGSNQSADVNLIKFIIPGSGVRTINLLSPLPTLIGPVIIDGYNQPESQSNTDPVNNNANILIELNGASAGDADGLVFAGGQQ